MKATSKTDDDTASPKERIRSRGLEIGFDKIGFAPVRLKREASRLDRWLELGYEGDMQWMAREPASRTDARRSHDATQTVVSCALNYYQGEPDKSDSSRGVISSYARGEDYHHVIAEKLAELGTFIEDTCGVAVKHYVDTGPLLEKGYGVAAGLG